MTKEAVGMAISGPVRAVSTRAPEVVVKALAHLHRWLIGNRVLQIQHDNFKIVVSPQDHCGGRLFYWGSYEPDQTAIFRKLIQEFKPDVFVDIGANIGYYSLVAASTGVPRVLSFEPSPTLGDCLESSIRANAWQSRIELHRLAVSDKAGTVTFYVNRADHNFGLGSIIGEHPESASQAITMSATTVDAFQSQLLGSRILMKIDVEGAELLVLEGMRRVSNSCRPWLVLEIHPADLGRLGRTAEEVLTWLESSAYVVTTLRNGREMPMDGTMGITKRPSWLICRPQG